MFLRVGVFSGRHAAQRKGTVESLGHNCSQALATGVTTSHWKMPFSQAGFLFSHRPAGSDTQLATRTFPPDPSPLPILLMWCNIIWARSTLCVCNSAYSSDSHSGSLELSTTQELVRNAYSQALPQTC